MLLQPVQYSYEIVVLFVLLHERTHLPIRIHEWVDFTYLYLLDSLNPMIEMGTGMSIILSKWIITLYK